MRQQTFNWMILLLWILAIRFSINTVYFPAAHTLYILFSVKHSHYNTSCSLSYLCSITYQRYLFTHPCKYTQRPSWLLNIPMSQKGMESFPPESRDWQALGNQWVGCQGVCLDPTTGDPTSVAPTEFLRTWRCHQQYRQMHCQAQSLFSCLRLHPSLKRRPFL